MTRWTWCLAAAGAVAAVTAAAADPAAAASAAGQTYSAFVLVAGLLLVGLVAAEDGLFAAAGQALGRACRGRLRLFAGVSALVMVVTALLNLDTSVAFLTPVVIHAGGVGGPAPGADDGRRDRGVAPLQGVLVSACLLLSNAGSLLLPGSNLTNLIVLGPLHMSGGRFLARMGLPWVVAGTITALVIAVGSRRSLRGAIDVAEEAERPVLGVGLAGVAAAVIVILAVGQPAPWVAGIGVVAALVRVVGSRIGWARMWDVVGLPVLTGLFGLAVGLGALGRAWSGPSRALAHSDSLATAALAAVAAVVINNLPAASLLSARSPAHPLSLLIGLDVGPNLFVSGSLAWVLWAKSARAARGRADVRRTVLIGLVAAPLSILAAVGALAVAGVS